MMTELPGIKPQHSYSGSYNGGRNAIDYSIHARIDLACIIAQKSDYVNIKFHENC